jgi:hypothetical protein
LFFLNCHIGWESDIKGKIKGADTEAVIKGVCQYSYQGCKNPVLLNKYITNKFMMYIIDISHTCNTHWIYCNNKYECGTWRRLCTHKKHGREGRPNSTNTFCGTPVSRVPPCEIIQMAILIWQDTVKSKLRHCETIFLKDENYATCFLIRKITYRINATVRKLC